VTVHDSRELAHPRRFRARRSRSPRTSPPVTRAGSGGAEPARTRASSEVARVTDVSGVCGWMKLRTYGPYAMSFVRRLAGERASVRRRGDGGRRSAAARRSAGGGLSFSVSTSRR